MYQSTATSESLQRQNFKPTEYLRSISSVGDSRARTLAQRVKELVLLTTRGTLPEADFGENTHGLFAKLSPNGSWLKMYRGYCQSPLLGFGGEDSEAYSETWPKWGMMLAGSAMELPTLEHRSSETECLLWPTASVCGNYNRKGVSATSGDSLATAVKNWPAPTAADALIGNLQSTQQKPGSMHSVNLSKAVSWPTPTQSDWRGACSAMIRKGGRKRNRLDFVVYEKQQGQLNADWVEILMGLPIGWTDIDCDNPQPWPGWPAPLNNNQNWGTHTAKHTPRSDRFISSAITPEEFTKLGMRADQYEYEPPRVVVGQKNRAKRLKALGNGCVPQQIYPVFAAIAEIERMSHEDRTS